LYAVFGIGEFFPFGFAERLHWNGGILILGGIGLAARGWGWAFAKRIQNFHRSPSLDDLNSNIGTKVKTTVVFWHNSGRPNLPPNAFGEGCGPIVKFGPDRANWGKC
jgi:hypothetical protein